VADGETGRLCLASLIACSRAWVVAGGETTQVCHGGVEEFNGKHRRPRDQPVKLVFRTRGSFTGYTAV
jgi:hypothetical protein